MGKRITLLRSKAKTIDHPKHLFEKMGKRITLLRSKAKIILSNPKFVWIDGYKNYTFTLKGKNNFKHPKHLFE